MTDFFVVKAPGFINTVNRINSGMNENAQLGIGKPLHLVFNVVRIYFRLGICAGGNYEEHTDNEGVFGSSHDRMFFLQM
jgi:hypothetical protein